MGIFKPKPMLSKNEVRLFRLIFELLETETVKSAYPSNYSGDYIPVSQKDTGKLDVLIKGLIEDRKFQEKLYLCENITSINNANELKLNKVYRIGRRLEGKAASFPSIEWHDLLKRIGVKVRYQALAYAQEMSFSYFLKMELKLLLHLNVSTELIGNIMELLENTRNSYRSVIDEQKKLPSIIDSVYRPFCENTFDRVSLLKDRTLVPKNHLVSAGMILANSAVLYTTRDWSAAGVASVITSKLIENSDI